MQRETFPSQIALMNEAIAGLKQAWRLLILTLRASNAERAAIAVWIPRQMKGN